MTDQPQSLAAALADLQQHLPRIGKDSEAVVETKTGRTYGDLATISRILLPMMAERGLFWMCGPTMHEGQFCLRWILGHVSDEPRALEGFYPLPSSTPQTMGGAITYARRYCLLAVTGAAPDEDDDDAQAAEQAARAQRNHPPEVRPDGSATEAELTRMNRGHEPGTWRATSTADNDPWYERGEGNAPADELPGAYGAGQPPLPGEPGEPLAPEEDKPGSIGRHQLSMMYAKFAVLGITDREKRLRWTEIVIGRPVSSANELSYREAGALLEALTEEARERSKDDA